MLFQALLAAARRAPDDRIEAAVGVEAFWALLCTQLEHDTDPMILASRGGLAARSVGEAFYVGYQAALRALSDRPWARGHRGALCVTEALGGHPRDLQTVLRSRADGSLELHGEKVFVTGAAWADWLWVLAVDARGGVVPPESKTKPFVLVELPKGREGLALVGMAHGEFVPEIEHAKLELSSVPVAPGELFSGDGFAGYVKRFRACEDLFVGVALAVYFYRLARKWEAPQAVVEELLALWAMGWALRDSALEAPEEHLVLEVFLRGLKNCATSLAEGETKGPEGARLALRRDLPVLSVAQRLRSLRTARAWSLLSGEALTSR